MKSANPTNLIKAIAFAFCLVFAPFAIAALAQNTGGTATQTTPAAQSTPSGGGSQTTRETTTTTTSQASQPTETTGINPIWFAVGALALIALIAIVVMAGKRSSGPDKTVYESKTTVKKD